MDFELNEDQQALQAAACSLLDGYASSKAVREHLATGNGFDGALWRAMLDQGWTGLAVPEAAGGLGLGIVEAAVVLEEVGAHVAPAPIVGQLVALDALAETEWAERLLDGTAIAATGASGGPEVVPHLPSASIVVAVRDDDLVAWEVPAGEAAPREPAMDVTREVGWLDPAGPAAAGGRVLGGAAFVERHRDVGAVAVAAELLGVARRMLDESVAYAKDRVQFGKPIGSFQAVKHRLADMLVDVEGMRSAVYWAAWCVQAGTCDQPHPEASVAASTAKTWCSDAARRVCASALQVHGGIGFTWEHDVHLYLKRAHLDGMWFGDAVWHRGRLAGLLRARVAAGETVL